LPRMAASRSPTASCCVRYVEFEQRDSASMHIAAPDRRGHDDLVMALALAVHVSPAVPVGAAVGRRRQMTYRGRGVDASSGGAVDRMRGAHALAEFERSTSEGETVPGWAS
jgi:hypothetical protein